MEIIGQDVKRYWLRAIVIPFTVLWCHKVRTLIWFMFVVFASQLGVMINVIQRCIFQDWELLPALGVESQAGTFYTFCMVMMASLIYPVFNRFLTNELPVYRNIGIVFVTFSFFILIFCAVFYGFSSQAAEYVDYSRLTNADMSMDVSQFVFFLMAIVFSLYSYGVGFLSQHEVLGKLDDRYLQNETDSVNEMNKNEDEMRQEIVRNKKGQEVQI